MFLLLVSNQDQRFQRPVCCRYTKEECARTHRTRMPDCVPPCRSNPFFADWIPGRIPWPNTLLIGWRMVRESNSPGASAPTVLAGLRLCRTAHHPMPVFSVRGTPARPRWVPHGTIHAGLAEWGGFEPPGACAPAVFGTVAFDRSATTPLIHTKEQTG